VFTLIVANLNTQRY